MRSKLVARHGADAQEASSLGGPVAAAARAVFRPGEDHQRHALGLVLHRRVVDGHRLAVGQMAGDAAFRARRQRLRRRMLANVPRVITRSLPRRDP